MVVGLKSGLSTPPPTPAFSNEHANCFPIPAPLQGPLTAWQLRDFPGGPVVKTLHFHCRWGGGTSSNPGWGTKIPHGMQCGQNLKSQKKRNPNIPPKLTPSRPTGESAGTGAYIITGRRSSHLYSMSVILKGRDYM